MTPGALEHEDHWDLGHWGNPQLVTTELANTPSRQYCVEHNSAPGEGRGGGGGGGKAIKIVHVSEHNLTFISARSRIIASFTRAPAPIDTPNPTYTLGPSCGGPDTDLIDQ